MIALSTRP